MCGNLSAERTRAVVAHLVRGCATCGRALAPDLAVLFAREDRLELPVAPAETYDEAIDRAFATVRAVARDLPAIRSAEQRKREAVDLLASRGLAGLGEAPESLQGLPLFEALLERSWVLRYENPGEMVELARSAALLADKLNATQHDAAEVADLRFRAWVELANSYRVADELQRADEALDRATEHFLQGSRDDLLAARFFTVLAWQYAARRYFRVACSTLGVVADIYQHRQDEHMVGRIRIMSGIFTGYAGKAKAAVRLIEEGLSLLDEQRDPGLVSTAQQNRARFLADCGRFREARRALWEFRRRSPDTGGRLNELKVRWLEGQIFVGLEDFERAEQALRQVKEGFEEARLPFKATLAGLELGSVLLRQDRLDDAIEVVQECTSVFLSLGIHREVLATVLLLHEASKRRHLTLTLLDAVIDELRKLEEGPGVLPHPAAEE